MHRFLKSIQHAAKGVQIVFKHEANFRIQTVVAVCMIVLGFVLEIRKYEFVTIVLLIILILVLEILNTAAERILDVLRPRLSYQVQVVKDIMAAAVLIAAFGAFVIGSMIFIPYLVELWYA